MAHGAWKRVSLQFDDAQREFETGWNSIYEEFGNKPQEAPIASRRLIVSQPLTTALVLAMARSDSVELFIRFKRLIESILRQTEGLPGYQAVAAIPHIQAGFLYMTASVMAFHWESWGLFEKLLTAKFEWYYHSGRAIFSYPFDLPYFFHSEALGRDAPKIHDFFRKELAEPDVVSATSLAGDRIVDAYVQTQMLMSLKAAQLHEKGESVSIWPDFGRFYGERITRLLDRAYENREYAQGLLRGFDEDPQTFFSHLNDRLSLIHSVFWGGSQYFYESLGSWEPREAHA
ncbi:MAG TPA: hypothetical protein VG649_03055 [Candidatus Angelobacter sp.]|nr:hypothetical protein [Candidatus Angelobacter sp.]